MGPLTLIGPFTCMKLFRLWLFYAHMGPFTTIWGPFVRGWSAPALVHNTKNNSTWSNITSMLLQLQVPTPKMTRTIRRTNAATITTTTWTSAAESFERSVSEYTRSWPSCARPSQHATSTSSWRRNHKTRMPRLRSHARSATCHPIVCLSPLARTAPTCAL